MKKNSFLPFIFIFGVALVVRLVFLHFYDIEEFPDVKKYVEAAEQLRSFSIIERHNIMPGYPLLIAAVGEHVVLADILLSSFTCVLLHLLSERIFGFVHRYLPFAVSLAYAFFPHSVFFAISGLTESLFVFLVVLAFLLFEVKRIYLAIVVLVLSILVRPILELAIPVLIILFSWLYFDRRYLRKHLIFFIAVYLATMSPWWAHNQFKYNSFVRLNLGDGIVWYAGNNPLNQSGGGIKGVDVETGSFERFKDPLEKNAAMKIAAFEYMWSNPSRVVELAYLKTQRFWSVIPYADGYQSWFVKLVSLSSIVPIYCGVFLFMVFYRRHLIRLLPYCFVVMWVWFVHALTIASIRYRFPIEWILIVVSVAGYFLSWQRYTLSRDSKRAN